MASNLEKLVGAGAAAPALAPALPSAAPSMGSVEGIPRVDPAQALANPDKVIADITRGEWEFEKQFFRPLEQRLGAKADESVGTFVDGARADVAQQYDNQQGRRQRDFARRGVNLSERAQRVMSRNASLGEAANDAGAANDARRRGYDRRLDILSTLAANAQGVASSGRTALGDAADMSQARDQAYKDQKAQSKASTVSTVSSLAGAALMAIPF